MLFGLFSQNSPVRVQPFFGFRNEQRLFLTARALRSHEPVFEKRSFWRNFSTLMRQYASHEVAGLPVTLEYQHADGIVHSQRIVTGPEGFACFDLPIGPAGEQPERTRWEKAVLRWDDPDDEGAVRETDAYVLAPGSKTQTGVISDIDDTILETGITGSFRAIARNWRRIFAQMPSERILVPGAHAFYAALGGDPGEPAKAAQALIPEARVRPVFYVSSSPWNLFSYLVAFKRDRELPLGPIMLRDWGLNRRTLGKEGHGTHKRQAIEHILTTFPHLRFALIGDDTQKDLAAFGDIASAFPGRIAAVFIRAVSGEALSAEQTRSKTVIEKSGVPFWSGNDYRAAVQFLEGAGLDIEGGVERLVRTASTNMQVSGGNRANEGE